MQSQQMAAMAGMNANVGGPMDGTPIMGNMQRPGRPQGSPPDSRERLNTYIYDYFLRNNHTRLARSMLECDVKMMLKPHPTKPSPSGRNVNGVDAMGQESRDDLPEPQLPEGQLADNSFLLDWWAQFWDIFNAARKQQPNEKGTQYITHTRNLTQMHNDQRNQRMMMANNAMGAQYSMMRAMPNGVGVAPNDLKRAAAMNNRNPYVSPASPGAAEPSTDPRAFAPRSNGNPMANMQMKNQAMLSAHMQRDGSGMEMNGQRPPSPGSSENAPSPNKRPRVEGNHFSSPQMGAARSHGMPQPSMGATSAGQANQMLLAGGMNAGNMPGSQFNEFAQAQNVQQKSIEVYAQSLAHQQRIALNNHAMAQGMNSGVQGSPMTQQGLDGQHDMFAGNQPRPGMPAAPGQPQGNHALQDYQMQLMLLEQQNKKRLLMARQEQDSMSGGPHGQPAVGAPGFPPSMSPQGSRAGPSPNPIDQMKRGTPKMNQQGLPGSPMPDVAMQQQRGSPAPNMNFDVTQMPPGMPPQFYNPQMQQTPLMRPPSSHPGFNGQPMTPQQMEQMRQSGAMQNGGAWRGPPGMMQPGQQLGPMGNNPQQRNQMPPPPAPAGEQPRAQEPSPSQPTQAPPTPNQGNKANPKKKVTKNDKPAKGKGTGATPAASAGDEPPTPTPSTPVTAHHTKPFGQNGQQQAVQPPSQPQPSAPQQQTAMDPNPPFGMSSEEPFDLGLGFGEQDSLESFDFDSFLHVSGEDGTFNTLTGDFGFGDTAEVGGDL
ncbi:hypothetical protein K505DRAFT_8395 [Melanomma pulvis-pyrius CBS 109.77]|uniref:LisH domain-containing protein n=1 Tax=Melanomma pulvis-pyrius CBS 109.77 TaxID=1314802 RepID=A0A6A6WNT2_9PLEO|nr:hypothetical protein K505DRAFT_8395 [Melanomma pulvis-pyrius CBS 109.77]